MQLQKIFKNLDKKYLNHSFSKIEFNSNNCEKNDIFFAIRGTKINGNRFINNAIKNGAKTIVSDLKFQGYKEDILFLKSKNPRRTLAEASTFFYNKKPKNLIAVTGTNGKTSVSNFFLQIMLLNNKKAAAIGTLGVNSKNIDYNLSNTTLDPLSLNKILYNLKKKKIDTVILEASSHGLKQNRLDGLRFDIGIFTNLSRDHLDYHKSFKNYFDSKMILFKKLMKKKSIVIFDSNLKYGFKIKKIVKKNNSKCLIIGEKGSNLKLIKQISFKDKQKVFFEYKKKIFSFETSLIGKIQIKNLLMAIIAASKYVRINKILKSIHKIKEVKGRMENIGKLNNNSKVILDYAHTPDALRVCLQNLKNHYKLSNISIVFGCGGDRDKPKRKMMGEVASNFCNRIYLTDDNPRNEKPFKIRNEIKKKINKSKLFEISSREKAIKQAILNLNSGDVLLVAGKGHENYQEYRKKILFSDRTCILKYIKEKNKSISNDWKINVINESLENFKISNSKKINKISINSKEIEKNDLFVALKGKIKNGNIFADNAIKNGALFSVIDKDYTKKFKDKKIKVKNTFNFFLKIAKNFRKASNINSIAITGSSGKTSLKELLGRSLNKLNSTFYTRKSFNNKFGVPISLLNIHKKNLYGVFEIGMDKKGEINELSKIVKPEIGVITNISYAHIKNFKNISKIAEAKSELIDNIAENGTIVLNKDDNFFNFFKNKAIKKNLKIISFSKKKIADIQYIKCVKKKSYYSITVKIQNKIKKFLVNEENYLYIDNILAALAVISNFIDIENLNNKLFLNFTIPNGRGNKINLKIGTKNLKIIDESYNSNPLSLKFAVHKFNKIGINNKRKNILLGDMLELGKFSKNLHIKIAKFINKSNANKIYVYGKHIRHTFDKIKTHKKGKIFKNKNEIIDFIKNDLSNNDYLMIKGSNATGLNEVVSKFNRGVI